jgi:hypothetical protein
VLVREGQAARASYSLERPAEAVTRYRAALTRARARDDTAAIADFGFDLTVAELRANQPAQALADSRALRADLARRGVASFPALDLVEATALYRTNAKADADQIAARVQRSSDPGAEAGATFLRGLIADEDGDVTGLRAAATALNSASVPANASGNARKDAPADAPGDAAELRARVALRDGDAAAAQRLAETSADLRREATDYRGVARALSLAAAAAEQQGDLEGAAALYLRAGRSAAAQGDAAAARPWLRDARRLSHDPALRKAAADAERSLTQP